MKRQLIRFVCKSCGARLAVPVSMGGRSDRCPKCKEVITAPLESEESAPPHAEKKAVSTPAPVPAPEEEVSSLQSEAPPQEMQPDLFQGLRRSLLDDFLSAPVKEEPGSGEPPVPSPAVETREAPALPVEVPELPRRERTEARSPEPETPPAEENIPELPDSDPVLSRAEEAAPAPVPSQAPEATATEEPSEMEQLTAPAWKPPMTEQEETAHQVMGMGHVLEDHSSSKTLPTMRHGVSGLGIGLMHLEDLPGRRGRRWKIRTFAIGIALFIVVDAAALLFIFSEKVRAWWHTPSATAVVSAASTAPQHPSKAPGASQETPSPKKSAESPEEEPKPKSPEIPEKKPEIAAADVTAKLPPATSDDSIPRHGDKENAESDKKEPAEPTTRKEPEAPSPPPTPPVSEPVPQLKLESILPKTSEAPPAPAPLPEPKMEAKPEVKAEPALVAAATPNPAPSAPAPIIAANSTKPELTPPLPVPPVPPAPPTPSAPNTPPAVTASSLTTAPAPISLPGIDGAPPVLLIPPPPPSKEPPPLPPLPSSAKTEEPAPLPEPSTTAKTESPEPLPPIVMAKQDSMISLLPPPSGANATPPSPPPLDKPTEDKPPAPLPEDKLESALPPKVTESGITSAARPAFDSLEKFLYASNWQERLKYSQKKESIRTEMEKHYRNHPDGPVAVSQIALVERYTNTKGGAPYCEFELRGGVLKQPVRVYVDEPAKGPPRVDWGAFVEFKDRLLWEFMDKPGAPAQKFRVVLLRKHYFDKDVPDMENKDSFAIVQPGIDLEGHVFAPHTSTPAHQLAQQLGWGANMPVILELVWRKDGAHRWVEIASVVEYGWKT